MEKSKNPQVPRGIVVAGMGGGSGKSVVAVGLSAAFTGAGHRVVPFKKGPDYIDAGWLARAAGAPCCNLDPYLMERSELLASFGRHAADAELIIIEGNRGLYDGVDLAGSYSTAELAMLLGLPVLLVVDCTKTTRTVAAQVLGCVHFEPKLHIAGVILNRIGSDRHERIVREAVETYAKVPVLGAIRRSRRDPFPQRHLGVTPAPEHRETDKAIRDLAALAEASMDLPGIFALTGEVPDFTGDTALGYEVPIGTGGERVRIGVIRDAAFQFYYPENLEGLIAQGAELVDLNALKDRVLPDDIDALYMGGGFPETNAPALAANESFRLSVRNQAEKGLPIYAECGGLIYLGEQLEMDGEIYPLVGLFPARFGLAGKPQAHGYSVLKAAANNPYYQEGVEVKGHEFRYSTVLSWGGDPSQLAFDVERGVGFMSGRDGLVYKNVLALYTHVHAVGTPSWAPAVVGMARRYRRERQ